MSDGRLKSFEGASRGRALRAMSIHRSRAVLFAARSGLAAARARACTKPRRLGSVHVGHVADRALTAGPPAALTRHVHQSDWDCSKNKSEWDRNARRARERDSHARGVPCRERSATPSLTCSPPTPRSVRACTRMIRPLAAPRAWWR
jgi:hypothetical protein